MSTNGTMSAIDFSKILGGMDEQIKTIKGDSKSQKTRLAEAIARMDRKKKDPSYKPRASNKFQFTTDGIVSAIEAYIKETRRQDIHVFPTGSRMFGVSSSESDYDICIYNEDYNMDGRVSSALFNAFGDYETIESDYNSGKKMVFTEFGNKIINIIPLSAHDYLYWMIATNCIADIARIAPKRIKDKTTRVSTFEMFKGLGRMIVGNEISIKTVDEYIKTKKKDENVIISKHQYAKAKGAKESKKILTDDDIPY